MCPKVDVGRWSLPFVAVSVAVAVTVLAVVAIAIAVAIAFAVTVVGIVTVTVVVVVVVAVVVVLKLLLLMCVTLRNLFLLLLFDLSEVAECVWPVVQPAWRLVLSSSLYLKESMASRMQRVDGETTALTGKHCCD